MIGKSVARKRQLLKFIPEILKCESMLYIGANPRRFELMDLFWAEAPQMKVDVMEAWEPNVEGLKALNAKYGIFRNILHDDIRDYADLDGIGDEQEYFGSYDVVMFWHGPEHLKIQEIPPVLEAMERAAEKLVILGCPWGKYPQGNVGGNPFEEHNSVLYPRMFQQWGYNTATIKKPNKRGGHILAWKEL